MTDTPKSEGEAELLAQARAEGLIPPSPSEADYARTTGETETLSPAEDPLGLFAEWLAAARASEPNDPNAMALATAGSSGLPDIRMVLLKDFDARGFVFYTNSLSAKGRQLAENPQAALCFHWKSLRRQIRLRGPVMETSPSEADSYFASRARAAQIGAWASSQSAPMAGRFALEKNIAEMALRFGLGPVPRPPHWKGYRLEPLAMEFWRDRPFRLHERIVFTRAPGAAGWARSALFP